MKVQVEVDDEVYTLMERLASDAGVNLEEFAGAVMNQFAYAIGANQDALLKAVGPDATSEEKAIYVDLMTTTTERAFEKLLGQVYQCRSCQQQFRIRSEDCNWVECPHCHTQYTREEVEDLKANK